MFPFDIFLTLDDNLQDRTEFNTSNVEAADKIGKERYLVMIFKKEENSLRYGEKLSRIPSDNKSKKLCIVEKKLLLLVHFLLMDHRVTVCTSVQNFLMCSLKQNLCRERRRQIIFHK